MPVKRRVAKRRVDPRAEAEAWAGIFQSGFAMFDDEPAALAAFGVALDEHGRPTRDAAEAAWGRLGGLYLATRQPGDVEPWASRQFGAPNAY